MGKVLDHFIPEAITDALAGADLGDDGPVDVYPDDADDLADVVAEWRRISGEYKHALEVASWFGNRQRELQAAAERILRRDPVRWFETPPMGCTISASITLTGDDN